MHRFRIPQISALLLLPIICLGCSANTNLRANLSAIHALRDDTQAIGSMDATPTALYPKHRHPLPPSRRITQSRVRPQSTLPI